jgi:hypothetical protein
MPADRGDDPAVITRLFPTLGAMVSASGNAVRHLLFQRALLSAAGLIGAAGFGFMVIAGFAALRLVVGLELAALIVGAILLALAAALVRFSLLACCKAQDTKPGGLPPSEPSPAPVQSPDPVTLAVFTAAFVLGRRLADRRRG